MSIPKRFLSIAEKYASDPAVVYLQDDRWESTSYSDLLNDAISVAIALKENGVKQGDAVLCSSQRNPQVAAHLLGILWLGAHYVVVDPAFPEERQQLILSESGARIGLFNQNKDQHELSHLAITWLNSANLKNNGQKIDFVDDDSLAGFLCFTSGSTGKPKGVLVPQKGMRRLVVDTNYFDFNRPIFLQLSTLSFDMATFEIWGALLNGGTCVFHHENGLPSLEGLARSIADNKIDSLGLTVSLFNWVISDAPQSLSGIKQLLVGGEALSVAHIVKALNELPNMKIYNGYGPTENSTLTTIYEIPQDFSVNEKRIPIGHPVSNTLCDVYDSDLNLLSNGEIGELITFGEGLALGYLNRPDLTNERFVSVPCSDGEVRRGYRTGDLVSKDKSGLYNFFGRNDNQVKIDGNRIELDEIEQVLQSMTFIEKARVLMRLSPSGKKRLAAYIECLDEDNKDSEVIRKALLEKLPKFMIPHFFIFLQKLPINLNGKLDESALPDPYEEEIISIGNDEIEKIWQQVLDRRVGGNTNFFDAGGTSIEAVKLTHLIENLYQKKLGATFIFEYPTIESQVKFFKNDIDSQAKKIKIEDVNTQDIAVIGLACRVPGANSVEDFWCNLLDGKESITFFSQDELDASIPDNEKTSARYVPAKGVVDDVEFFDADFFDISPREADFLDPQQRIMLQLTWHALEDAGYAQQGKALNAGVYVGGDWPRYYRTHIEPNKVLLDSYGDFNALLANERDFLATRISYKLNLTGPSVNVATACSTGLVAIANATKALQTNECELAVAGGISISTPLNAGYLYQEGGMLSADGHTKTFDSEATGTTFNDGAGLVVLKRLDRAQQDGDRIYAVIKGTAVNNDGAVKASFTAPSVAGQVDVYQAAVSDAGVNPEDVGFIETHGTATPLGDPIEVASLKRIYDPKTQDGLNSNLLPCALGAVKSNIGHMIHAAGVVGFIKTVKVVAEGKIPPTLHYKKANPNLELDNSRFYVNADLAQWESDSPRLAAVTSLGVGGTNAHVIVQEYQAEQEDGVDSQDDLNLNSQHFPVLISAKTETALQLQVNAYHDYLAKCDDTFDLLRFSHVNTCYKSSLPFRTSVVGDSYHSILGSLKKLKLPKKIINVTDKSQAVGFIFTGQGSQRKDMGLDLYQQDKLFCQTIDRGIKRLTQLAQDDDSLSYLVDFKSVLFRSEDKIQIEDDRINQTRFSQPALFLYEYALAQYLNRCGVQPTFYIGHSIGEWVAAALLGVFDFEDALSLVAYRGYLMHAMQPGSMLSVQCDANAIGRYCLAGIDIAAYNAPGITALAGEDSTINAVISLLEKDEIPFSQLVTSHAFHSAMMDPMVDAFEKKIEQYTRYEADLSQCQMISTVTAKPVSNEELISARYWAEQVRKPVKFSQALTCLNELLMVEHQACVEIGPGDVLTKLLSRHDFARGEEASCLAVASQPSFGLDSTGTREVVTALTKLWERGFAVDWTQFYPSSKGENSRVKGQQLPLYRFSRDRHWIDSPSSKDQSNYSIQPSLVNNEGQQTTRKIVEKPMSVEQHQVEVQKKLRAIFEDVSGYDLSGFDADLHFSEIGLDSLLLTQAALAIEKQYGGDITFRMLAETYTDLAALSEYMAEFIPAEMVAVEEVVPVAAVASASMDSGAMQVQTQLSAIPLANVGALPAGNNDVAALLQSQLQIMQMQLQALTGASVVQSQPNTNATQNQAANIPNDVVKTSEAKQSDKKQDASAADKPLSAVTKNAMRMTRISREVIGANLTSAQQKWVDGVMAAFQEKFAESKKITQQHRKYFSDPRSVSGFNPTWKEIVFPMVVNRSKGSKLWDVEGNEFIDVTNGFGPILFGHSPDFIMDAVKAQFEEGIETGPQHPLAGEVAQLVCDITGNERCAYANTGSEAMACALRMVRTATGKETIIVFEGSYHGIFDEMVARPGANHQGMPLAPGIPRSALANVKVVPWGDQESIDIIRSMEDVAAVVVETIQSRNPKIQDVEYIKQLRDVATDIDAALIFDEIVTGFRVAAGGIQERFGIKADMVTYGKILGGGFPIGLVAGKAKYMDALDGGYWDFGDDSIPEAGVTFFAGTFLRHPAALAAAKQVLLKIKADGPAMYQALDAKAERLSTEVNAVIKRLGCGITFDSFSSMFYVKVPDNAHWGHLLYKLMLLEGVFFVQNAGSFLTTAHSDEDISKIIAAFTKSIALLVTNGLIEGNMIEANNLLSVKSIIPEGARLGKNEQGEPAYFIEDENNPGQYIEVGKP